MTIISFFFFFRCQVCSVTVIRHPLPHPPCLLTQWGLWSPAPSAGVRIERGPPCRAVNILLLMSSFLSFICTSSPWFAPTIYRVPCRTRVRGERWWTSPCVFLSVAYVGIITDQPAGAFQPTYYSVSLPNLLDESLQTHLPCEKVCFSFPCRMKSCVHRGVNNLMDSSTLLLTDLHSKSQKHGTYQGEFIPCVNSYHMETIWVYKRPNHFCTEREM